MNPKWAEENLHTIRTLMERSALYRRALAPVMLVCGIAGLAGGVAGWQWHPQFLPGICHRLDEHGAVRADLLHLAVAQAGLERI